MLRAFLRAPSALFGLVALIVLAVLSAVAPPALGGHAIELDFGAVSQGSSTAHLLGTDRLGRDILVRVLVATRLSLSLAVVAALVAAAIGYPIGVGAALLPPRLRSLTLRGIDTALAFPGIIVAIFVSAVVGPGEIGSSLGVGIAISFSFARVASTLALSIGGREYVQAARVLGIRGPRLMTRYVLPNVAETLAIQSTVAIGTSIVQVASLSFLGLGVQPPAFDWGTMLTEGVRALYLTPTAAIGPAVAIAISSLAFGLTGEAVARAMNPVLWTADRPSRGAAKPTPAADAVHDAALPLPTGVEALLDVTDLTVTFPGPTGPVRVVDGVTFTMAQGEMLGIVGESGSGKTMTALALARLVPYPGEVSGAVALAGERLDRLPPTRLDRLLATKLAVVFQDPMSSLNPALRIGAQMTEASEAHRGLTNRDATALAASTLRAVNIPVPEVQLARHPFELSGGMRQRVMIAMGLMNQPALLLADEPTTALDVTIQAQIMELLDRINADDRRAIVLISHNIGLVSQNCDRVMVMYAGRVVEDGATGALISEPLHPYTRALVAAVPDMSRPRDVPLASITGQAADPANLPPGCPYHPRCPLAVERCRSSRPRLEVQAGGRRVACWVAGGAAS